MRIHPPALPFFAASSARRLCHGLLALMACLSVGLATAQDAVALQRSAIERLDAAVAGMRRSGDTSAGKAAFNQSVEDLSQSNAMLTAQAPSAELALGLIKLGSAQRLLGRSEAAAASYKRAELVAQIAGATALQADALVWQGQVMLNTGQLEAGLAYSTRAVDLAQAAGDADVLTRALGVLGALQVARGDLSGAAATAEQELAASVRATDPMAGFYAHLDRADVNIKVAERCDFETDFAPCHSAARQARDELLLAKDIAHKLGYEWLAQSTGSMVSGVEARAQLIRQRERLLSPR